MLEQRDEWCSADVASAIIDQRCVQELFDGNTLLDSQRRVFWYASVVIITVEDPVGKVIDIIGQVGWDDLLAIVGEYEPADGGIRKVFQLVFCDAQCIALYKGDGDVRVLLFELADVERQDTPE